jgi:N-methylhydantoinase A
VGDLELFMPTVSVTSIGKGGGSIARVDEHGVLAVGPDSAGSTPGPVCYGRGGTEATLTDAFVVNGWIGHSALGYDAVRIDRDAARRAVGLLATRLGLGLHETASAIIEIAVSGMYSGVSGVVSRTGIDPAHFSLLGFGGAGPMLSCFLARALGIGHVVIPATPGVLSALGGLVSDLRNDFIRTVHAELDPAGLALFRAALAELEEAGTTWLRHGQNHSGPMRIALSGQMRYRGQSYEIDTPLAAEWLHSGDLAACAEAFHAQHQRLFGHSDPAAPVQIVSLCLQAIGERPRPQLARIARGDGTPLQAGRVEVWIGEQRREVPLYHRADLLAGDRFPGPAIVAQPDTTTAIPDGFTVEIDDYAAMHLTPGENSQ